MFTDTTNECAVKCRCPIVNRQCCQHIVSSRNVVVVGSAKLHYGLATLQWHTLNTHSTLTRYSLTVEWSCTRHINGMQQLHLRSFNYTVTNPNCAGSIALVINLVELHCIYKVQIQLTNRQLTGCVPILYLINLMKQMLIKQMRERIYFL